MPERTPITKVDAAIAALIVASVLWGLFRVSGVTSLAGGLLALVAVLLVARSQRTQPTLRA